MRKKTLFFINFFIQDRTQSKASIDSGDVVKEKKPKKSKKKVGSFLCLFVWTVSVFYMKLFCSTNWNKIQENEQCLDLPNSFHWSEVHNHNISRKQVDYNFVLFQPTFFISNYIFSIFNHHITSHHITSHHITSHHITSHHITSQRKQKKKNTKPHCWRKHRSLLKSEKRWLFVINIDICSLLGLYQNFMSLFHNFKR